MAKPEIELLIQLSKDYQIYIYIFFNVKLLYK